MKNVRREVPCGTCRTCCVNEAVYLHPENGDMISSYMTDLTTHPLTGKPAFILQHKPNGECFYLDKATGCTIHDRAPHICQTFDCRALWQKLSTAQRREMWNDPETRARLRAGRDRLGK